MVNDENAIKGRMLIKKKLHVKCHTNKADSVGFKVEL